MADNKITIEVAATGNAEVFINGVTKATKELGDKGSENLDKFSGAFDVFTGIIGAKAVISAFSSLTDAAESLFDTLITDGVNSAIQQEDALVKLTFALGQAGDASASAVKDFEAFASRIQATTKFQDDAIISAGALLSSLTGLSGQGLQRATEAAANLSTTLGKDLDTVVTGLAKGFNGSTEGLLKFGIRLDDSKPKAQALADALDRINAGGAAAKQVDTFSGAVAQAKNNFDKLGQSFGEVVINNKALLNIIKAVNNIFVTLTSGIQGNRNAFSDFLTNGILLVIRGLQIFIPAVIASAATMLELQKALAETTSVAITLAKVFTLGLADIDDSAENSKAVISELDKQIAALKDNKAVDALNDGLFKLEKSTEASLIGFSGMATEAEAASRGIQSLSDATSRLSEEQKKFVEEQKKAAQAEVSKADPEAEINKKIANLQLALDLDSKDFATRHDALYQFEQDQNAIKQTSRDQELTAIDAFEQEKFVLVANKAKETADFIIAQNKLLIEDGLAKNADKIASNDEALAHIFESETLLSKDTLKLKQDSAAQEIAINNKKSQAIQTALTSLASFQNSKVKELAVIGKAAAIAQATINTFQGATLALANIPFPFGFIAAAAVTAAGLVNIAKIAGADLATGITEVPPGFSNDTFAANLSSGERVVDANTNQDLKLFLATNNNNTELLSGILERLNRIENRTVVNIGGREIINEVQRQIDSGRALSV